MTALSAAAGLRAAENRYYDANPVDESPILRE